MNATATVSLSMDSCASEFKNRVYVNVSEGASMSERLQVLVYEVARVNTCE